MKHSDDDKMIDILIGEAVLSLLHENGPISSAALVARLELMSENEDAAQVSLLHRAIVEVREGISTARNRNHDEPSASDSHRHVSSIKNVPQGSKKH